MGPPSFRPSFVRAFPVEGEIEAQTFERRETGREKEPVRIKGPEPQKPFPVQREPEKKSFDRAQEKKVHLKVEKEEQVQIKRTQKKSLQIPGSEREWFQRQASSIKGS